MKPALRFVNTAARDEQLLRDAGFSVMWDIRGVAAVGQYGTTYLDWPYTPGASSDPVIRAALVRDLRERLVPAHTGKA